MAKDSKEAYGASGKTNLLLFDPDDIILVEDKSHPLYDERVHLPVDERLVLLMMEIGFFDPIIIWKDPEDDKVYCVDGRQRTKAAREANKRLKKQGAPLLRVSALPRSGSSKETSLMGVMAASNELRKANKPLHKAALMARMLERGSTEEELVMFFGVSKATIKNMLSLNECTAAVRKAIEHKRIPISLAYDIARLPAAEQKERLEKVLATLENGVEDVPRRRKAVEVIGGDDDGEGDDSGNGTPPPKRKKRGTGRAAREIVRGTPLIRGKKDILEKREEVATLDRIKENHRIAMLAALDWVLGNDAALDALI